MTVADTTSTTRPSVFISYSRETDAHVADELAVALASLGFAVSTDVRDTPAGTPWNLHILDLVRRSAVFVPLISKDSIKSDHCKEEWEAAVKERKLLLPVRTETFEVADLPESFPAALSQRHWIDYVGPNRSFAHLVRQIDEAIRTDAAWYREQNYLAALERDWRNQQKGDKPSFLLSKSQANRARQMLRSRGQGLPEPTAAVLEFLVASETEHLRLDAEQRRLKSRKQLVAFVATLLAAMTALLLTKLHEAQSDRLNAGATLDGAKDASRELPNVFTPTPKAKQPPTMSIPMIEVPIPADELKNLTDQFSLPGRRAASDELRRRYLEAGTAPQIRQQIVNATVAALQGKGLSTSYRVNLYVFVTLGRLPDWEVTEEQDKALNKAMLMYADDATYNWWTTRAREIRKQAAR